MKEIFYTGFFTLSGTIAGGLLTYLGNRHIVKHEEAKKRNTQIV